MKGRSEAGAANTFVNSTDDSYDVWQDGDPNFDKNGKLVIVDVDAPSTAVRISQTQYMVHKRANYDEWSVFHFYPDVPERSSKPLKWSMIGDAALNYDDKTTFIIGAANDGRDSNEVFIGNHIATLDNLLATPTLAVAATLINNDKKIKRNTDVVVVVTGADLAGEFFLRKAGAEDIIASLMRVKTTDAIANTSDLKEVRVTFNTDAAVAGGYVLMAKNQGGNSNEIAGFEIIA